MIRHVLFVDDDPNILHGIKRTMRSLQNHLESDFAKNASVALTKMAARPFDVVISDMRMPGMNGADFLDEVQSVYPHVIRIILSGQSDEDLIMRSLGSAHQYMAKPCNSDTIKRTVDRACAIQDHLLDDGLKKMVTGLSCLPTLPSLYTQLVEELQSVEGSLDRVGEIISQDVALCTKMLQIVNSAFFGLARPIANAKVAVHHLGFETVKSLVLSVKVVEEFSHPEPRGFTMEGLLNHCVRTGLLAQAICKSEHTDQEFIDQALTAGMLHDVGKLILAHDCPEAYISIMNWQRIHSVTKEQAELAVLGSTHSHVGGYLLGAWGLPPSIVEAVLYHHHPSQIDFERFSPLTAVHVANVLLEESSEDPHLKKASFDESYLRQIGKWERLSEWQYLHHEQLVECR